MIETRSKPLTIHCPEAVLRQLPALLWDSELERVAVFTGVAIDSHLQIVDVVPTDNAHPDPRNAFAMTRQEWRRVRKWATSRDQRILGVVHSHPSPHPAGPSDDDLDYARRFSRFPAMAVYHCPTSTVVWYDEQGETRRVHVKPSWLVRLANRLVGC